MRDPNSPTVDLVVLFGLVHLCQRLGGVVGLGTVWFALATPVSRPWTLLTAVYAHASVGHLLANAVALSLVGLALKRVTTRLRFHAFVFGTGTFAALAELLARAILGTSAGVLGASGAVLALYGYVLAGTPITGWVLGAVDIGRRGRAVLAVVAALVVTALTAGPDVALVAHVTGFGMGVVAGRAGVLGEASRI
jgi:membrane associated rhomboid family serine protease